MNAIKNSVPKLRFSEFSGDWKNTILGKATNINPKSENLPNSFIYIDLESVCDGVLNKENRIKKKEAPSRAQRLLKQNDILYQTVRPYQKNNYFFNKNEDDYVASTGYAQIRTKNFAIFIYQYLHTDYFVNKVLLRCTGTSYPSINSSDLCEIKIKIPELPEQQKIASFLTSIDTKIEQLTKKKSLLEQYKKGIMQQIFSQELRFKDEKGNDYPDWEEKKLGEVGIFRSGVGFSNSEQGGVKGVAFYKVSDMNLSGNELRMHNSNNYVSREQILKLKYNVIKDESIIFAKVGAAIFLERKRIAMNFLIDNNMMAFTPKGNIYFFKNLFDTIRLSKFAQVGALPSYNASDLKIIKITIPSFKEQAPIANFLSAIDIKIELVNIQIGNTQKFKKGLLQQLFV